MYFSYIINYLNWNRMSVRLAYFLLKSLTIARLSAMIDLANIVKERINIIDAFSFDRDLIFKSSCRLSLVSLTFVTFWSSSAEVLCSVIAGCRVTVPAPRLWVLFLLLINRIGLQELSCRRLICGSCCEKSRSYSTARYVRARLS